MVRLSILPVKVFENSANRWNSQSLAPDWIRRLSGRISDLSPG